MSTFTLTKDGFEFTNSNNQVKNIIINDSTNKIDFTEFSISITEVENKEHDEAAAVATKAEAIAANLGIVVVPPEQDGGGGDQGGGVVVQYTISSPDSWIVESGENHGFFALLSENTYKLTRPGYYNHEHLVSLYDNEIKWITGADKGRLSGVVGANSISWSDQTTWTRFVSGD